MEAPSRQLSGGLKKTMNLKIDRIPNDPTKTITRQPKLKGDTYTDGIVMI
jgi:hypothetical protein